MPRLIPDVLHSWAVIPYQSEITVTLIGVMDLGPLAPVVLAANAPIDDLSLYGHGSEG